jgi:hypothetical protein
MAAGAPAVDLPEPAPQVAQLERAALGEPLQLTGDGVQAEQARAAQACRLVREIAHQPGGLGEPARVVGQGRDQASADAGAYGGEACR